MAEHMRDHRSEMDASDEMAAGRSDATRFRDRDSGAREISEDDIRNRAHELYLRRGGSDGDPVADWLEAERDLRGRSGATRTPDDLGSSDDPRDLGRRDEET